LDEYCTARKRAADFYDASFSEIEELKTPVRQSNSTHVFHQYTLQVKDGRRDDLQKHLQTSGIPSMIYYPVPLYRQKAFAPFVTSDFVLPITEKLCVSVLSLPIHTEMNEELLSFISGHVKEFFD
jgi:dTDP-4-amino-4,6-dideoxygalactose transaminase